MGGGKKSKAPPAPNYSALASQEAAAQKEIAEKLTQWNRPTQNNPFGQIGWTKDAGGNWTQTETWDPRILAGYEQALGLKDSALSDLANQGAFPSSKRQQIRWDPNSGQKTADAFYQSYMSRAGKEQENQLTKLDTKLRQQGLQPGTEAYDRAKQNYLTSFGDVNAKAALDASVLGGEEARKNFQARLLGQQQNFGQDLSTWQSGWDRAGAANNLLNSQYRPAFSGFSGATGYSPADLMGAAQAQYTAGMNASNASNAKKGNTLNAAASLGGRFF